VAQERPGSVNGSFCQDLEFVDVTWLRRRVIDLNAIPPFPHPA
jgi:hypothetical protein